MLVMMLTTLVGTDTPAHKVSHFTRMLEALECLWFLEIGYYCQPHYFFNDGLNGPMSAKLISLCSPDGEHLQEIHPATVGATIDVTGDEAFTSPDNQGSSCARQVLH